MNFAAHNPQPPIKFDDRGLITAVIQQKTGQTHFWSRSRQQLWHKGATSGNVQYVQEIRLDCDGDTLLILVNPAGPACHTGATSCFYQTLNTD
jgi:phosphoribosyl-AMP cyclohydrolase